ncbi:MAG: glycoside hydrolase family 2 protein [Lachnospiraceae bacterium]|nr:glycoside hydrolase family 2 protein [Lachnospiraceae bacterium]
MREIIHLNHEWEFTGEFTEDFLKGHLTDVTGVDLPHTCHETPFNYFDESIYQMVCGYRRRLVLPENARGKRVFLVVGAAGHSAQVYVDGMACGKRHNCGYTQFTVELTDVLEAGRESLLVIEVDSREQQNMPPFGHVIDYMTYGGLYREVRLEIREDSYIEDVFAKPFIPEGEGMTKSSYSPQEIAAVRFDGRLESEVRVVNGEGCVLRQTIFEYKDTQGIPLCAASFKTSTGNLIVPKARLWDVESPALYTLVTELIRNEEVIDRVETTFGFRRAVFETDCFRLNGRRLKLVGLNRHQSFPYVGYAMPKSMQRLDAEILKQELGVNAVRTSHYPQSQHFIDRCDELGLLVFTEIPGWQHIGDDEWKNIAVENTKEMVLQYRNHPSIILWGVRINESVDDDELYKRTNETARRLDSTRQTAGVRCNKKSSLLEDVYTYNDFVHEGTNRGCEPKKNVTSDINKPYMISEYNGHMYPTKAFDDEEHRLEHALRHARVLDAVAGEDDIAGSFGWCFFDYNTHKDFGSGDRICYHGVCDMFRNSKPAADVYASMQRKTPVLSVSSSMDIGEHPAGNRGRVYMFTNADSVRFYKNDKFITEYEPKSSEFKNLKNPPIELDDFIGGQIAENEGFADRQARYVKDILNESTRFGMSRLSFKSKLKAAWLMARYRMSFDDAYALYGRYIGNWGDKATVYRFEAVKEGQVVKTVDKSTFTKLKLAAVSSHTELVENETYDVAAIRIRATDQNDNVLPFYNGAVNIETEGDIEVIGPKTAILRGGMGGTYIRTKGVAGDASVRLTLETGESKELLFSIRVVD